MEGKIIIGLIMGIFLIGSIFIIPLIKNSDSISPTYFEDDKNIKSEINSYLEKGNLIIEYETLEEKVWIEGLNPERYFINEKEIIIYNYNPQERFKLHIGEESDIYKFGRLIGYKFLDDGDVVHIWNNATISDYFFEKDAGIQLTNHYEDYWTKNIFCIGYYSGEEWIKIACADELTNFEKSIETDNETYVNATLWKDIEYGNYDLRLGVQYHLGLNDENLSITIYGKNIGIDIPFDLGFAWKVTDWDIPSNENEDYMIINNTGYIIKGTYDLTFRDMEESFFKGRDSTYNFGGKFLRVDWNENLNYVVKMFGNGNQGDFYVALLINVGHFNPQQEKSTTFQWIDALIDGTNAGFVIVAPSADPDGTNIGGADDSAMALKDTSPAGATKITEIGWYAPDATEEANFEVGIYTHNVGDDEPEAVVGALSQTNAKGTTAGWKRVTGLNIPIDEETIYWMAFQLDDTATNTGIDVSNSVGSRWGAKFTETELTAPWGASDFLEDNVIIAIYAIYELEGSLVAKYNLNENSGTITHDVSGNSNDGTISGATWNNDKINITLTNLVDYKWTTTAFQIINDNLAWTGIYVGYNYNTLSSSRQDLNIIKGNYSKSATNTSAQFPAIGTIIGIAILLLILIALLIFAIRKMMGVAGATNKDNENGGGSGFPKVGRSFS